MDWEPTRISKLTQRQNLELADKQTEWVDKSERDKCYREGRCLRCGRTECSAPLVPPLARRRSHVFGQKGPNPVKKTRPVMEALVDESDLDSHSSSSEQIESDDEESKDWLLVEVVAWSHRR
jgi:hypothetical protein